MKLVFLGTASAFPTPDRGVSCTALQLDDGQIWLFDCGEGSQIQLQKSSLKPGKISKIFITHLHGDHLFGLPGLLCTLANGQEGEALSQKVIELYGPVGIRKYVTMSMGLSRSPPAFKLSVVELVPRPDQYPENWNNWKVDHVLSEDEKLGAESAYRKVDFSPESKTWPLLESKQFKVNAVALVHRIPSFGFHIQESPSPGQLDVKKLQTLGVKPGPLFGRLKNGETVTWNEQILNPEDFLGPPVPGRELAIFGDTCNSEEILNIAKSPDVFVHEATMENSLEEKCISFGHSTPKMAADIALRSRAHQLILFHLSPRYKPVLEDGANLKPDEVYESTLQQEAQTFIKEKGETMNVTVAHDFMEFDVNRKRC